MKRHQNVRSIHTQRCKSQNRRIQLKNQPTLLRGLVECIPDIADPSLLGRFLDHVWRGVHGCFVGNSRWRSHFDGNIRNSLECLTRSRSNLLYVNYILDQAYRQNPPWHNKIDLRRGTSLLHFSSLTTVAQFPHGLYIPEYILSKLIAV